MKVKTKIEMKGLFGLIFLIISGWMMITSCHPICQCHPHPEENPVTVLTDSNGEPAEEFAVLDSVFGSFSGLLPNTRYTIQVMRSDENEISRSSYTSDNRGIIPTAALWWDVGVEYHKSRVGKLNQELLFRYTYHYLVKRGERIVYRIPIQITPMEEIGPIIYSSNKHGDPLNAFGEQREDVYVTGRNFLPGSTLHIHVVRDRYSWKVGDRIERVFEKTHVLQLGKSQRDFTELIWPGKDLKIGSYDIIIEYEAKDALFDRRDFIDSGYSVGFTVFKLRPSPPPRSLPHLEAELACQAPPQDPNTGTVIGVPNPIYKDHFGTEEEVWVAVNPYTGGQDYTYETARLYVVEHKSESEWLDNTPLDDVSDGYEEVTIQPGCANVNYTRVWESPAVREEGYDVVVDFSPFEEYNKGQDIVDSLDAKGFVVPTLWVCLESISFNHNPNSNSSDAMNIRKNHTEDVLVPEWKKAEESHPAAYIKDRSITVEAVFSAASNVTSAEIRADTIYGYLGNISQDTVQFNNGTGSLLFQVSTNTPNEIKSFYQKWGWYCQNVNNSGSTEVHLGESRNKIFIVLAEPQSPWETTGQEKPWTDVLTKSCSWAYGETTAVGAAEKITKKLFQTVGGLYDTEWGSSFYADNGWEGDFDLTNFLDNIPNIGVVNCYDMGKSLVIFSNVVGCGLSYRRSDPFGYLNCIHAIGRGWTNNPFCQNTIYNYDPNPIVPEDWDDSNGRSKFGNHAFGSISDNIFDACLTVDTDDNPDYEPHLIESWMINEPWNNFKTKVVDNNPSTSSGYPSTWTFDIY